MGNYSKKGDLKKNDPGRWKYGNRVPEIIKELRVLEIKDLTITFSDKIRWTKDKLEELVKNPEAIAKDIGIAKAILMWIRTGDFRYVQPFIEYIFGKPKETIAHTGADGQAIVFQILKSYDVKNNPDRINNQANPLLGCDIQRESTSTE